MVTPTQTTTLVELHVDNFEKVKNFYTKFGFEIVWEKEADEYKGLLVLKGEENILYFWPGNERVFDNTYFGKFPKDSKRGYCVEICIMVNDDIEKLYESIKNVANIVEELELKPWGIKDFRIEDPFGYYLKFTEPYNILDKNIALP